MGHAYRSARVNARETILSAIRRAAVPQAPPAPACSSPAPSHDLLDTFLQVLATVGGQGVLRTGTQTVPELLIDIAAALGVTNPADILVVPGQCAVAENGAVYVDAADLTARADIIRVEHLVITVPRDGLVPTMHEAMQRIPRRSACGWFLSGPSKTADIEQALVIGAQGARTLHVIVDVD